MNIEIPDYEDMTREELIETLEAHDAHHQEHHEREDNKVNPWPIIENIATLLCAVFLCCYFANGWGALFLMNLNVPKSKDE